MVDLTQPLHEGTPIIQLPPPFANTPGWKMHEISAYDERGPLPKDGWLLYRTGWDARAQDQAAFINANESGPHSPGLAPETARWLAEEAPVVGLGVETVGTDAGAAHSFDPPFPSPFCHPERSEGSRRRHAHCV